jgi:hypothetical protein
MKPTNAAAPELFHREPANSHISSMSRAGEGVGAPAWQDAVCKA